MLGTHRDDPSFRLDSWHGFSEGDSGLLGLQGMLI